MSIFGVTKEADDDDIKESVKEKSYITVYAEEARKLNPGTYEWGFGDGTYGCKNSGYTFLTGGKIVQMGLASENSDKGNDSRITVQIVKNGTPIHGYTITKNPNQYSAYTIFRRPFVMEAGEVLNFITVEASLVKEGSKPIESRLKIAASVLSVLIELGNI